MARTQVLLAAVLFGTTGTAQALGPEGMDPVAVGAGRILVGGALLVLVARGLPRVRGDRRALTAFGIAGAFVAVYQLAFFAAVDRTGVAVGTVVAIGSGPVFAGAFGWLALRESPGGRWAVCTALAGAGVALLVLGGGSASVEVTGVGLALVSGAGYAAYTVAAKELLRAGRRPEEVMAGAFGLGALLLLPVLAATAEGPLLEAGGLATVVYLGVLPTAVAYVLFARGLQHLTAGETATLTLAEPLTAAALGAIVLGERPSALAVAGGLLVLAGLLALAVKRPQVVPEPVPAA